MIEVRLFTLFMLHYCYCYLKKIINKADCLFQVEFVKANIQKIFSFYIQNFKISNDLSVTKLCPNFLRILYIYSNMSKLSIQMLFPSMRFFLKVTITFLHTESYNQYYCYFHIIFTSQITIWKPGCTNQLANHPRNILPKASTAKFRAANADARPINGYLARPVHLHIYLIFSHNPDGN